jgi:hypothetical protein
MTGIVELPGTHCDQCLKVCRYRSAGWKITARLREPSRTTSGEQRTKEQYRTTQLADQCWIGPISCE